MLATKVLASGVTHLTDARYFAAWEVAYLAFPVGEGPGERISWDYVAALREWVEGPAIVAELPPAADPALWLPLLGAHSFTTVLLPSPLAPAAAPLLAAGLEVIARVPVEGYQSAEDVAERLTALPEGALALLDFAAGGITYNDLAAGYPFGTDALESLLRKRDCLLEMAVPADVVKTFVETSAVHGLAVRGSSEEKVGYKSFDDLDDLFEALEIFV